MMKSLAVKVGTFFDNIAKTCFPSRKEARKKHRLKALLAWLAKGAEHTCPT